MELTESQSLRSVQNTLDSSSQAKKIIPSLSTGGCSSVKSQLVEELFDRLRGSSYEIDCSCDCGRKGLRKLRFSYATGDKSSHSHWLLAYSIPRWMKPFFSHSLFLWPHLVPFRFVFLDDIANDIPFSSSRFLFVTRMINDSLSRLLTLANSFTHAVNSSG